MNKREALIRALEFAAMDIATDAQTCVERWAGEVDDQDIARLQAALEEIAASLDARAARLRASTKQ